MFGLQLNENIFCCPKGFSKLTGKIAHVYTHNYTCAIFRVRSSPRPFSTLETTSLTILFTLYIVSKNFYQKVNLHPISKISQQLRLLALVTLTFWSKVVISFLECFMVIFWTICSCSSLFKCSTIRSLIHFAFNPRVSGNVFFWSREQEWLCLP